MMDTMVLWGIGTSIIRVLADISIIILAFKSVQAINIYIKKNK